MYKYQYRMHHTICQLMSSTLPFHLIVAPTVTLLPVTMAIQGEFLALDCQLLGNPQPSLVWEREGVAVETSERVSIDSDGRLEFSPVLSDDAGSYTCTATNSFGTASADTALTVLGKQRRVASAWLALFPGPWVRFTSDSSGARVWYFFSCTRVTHRVEGGEGIFAWVRTAAVLRERMEGGESTLVIATL